MKTKASVDTSDQIDCRVAQTKLGEKFASLRQEASARAVQHRERLERARASAKNTVDASGTAEEMPAMKTARLETAVNSADVRGSVAAPQPIERKHVSTPQNFDLIALWSVVGPSTIAAVFAGVAMSQNHIPIVYALSFIVAWFALTSCMALGAVKLFNSRSVLSFMRASAPRFGVAVISCALASVLLVEATRISITAIATPAPQQTSGVLKRSSELVKPAQRAKTALTSLRSTRKASRAPEVADARSVHFPTTPDVLPTPQKPPKLEASIDETIVALPAPSIELEEQIAQETVTKEPSGKQPKGELLGRISEKGKFVAHRGSSKWSSSSKRVSVARNTSQQKSKSDNQTILEKIFKPVINSAGAQPPARGIGSEIESLNSPSR